MNIPDEVTGWDGRVLWLELNGHMCETKGKPLCILWMSIVGHQRWFTFYILLTNWQGGLVSGQHPAPVKQHKQWKQIKVTYIQSSWDKSHLMLDTVIDTCESCLEEAGPLSTWILSAKMVAHIGYWNVRRLLQPSKLAQVIRDGAL